MSTIRSSSVSTESPVAPSASPAGQRVLANPAPLGLAAFALTTFVLSLANAGIVPTAGVAVLGLALFYGGLAQFAAGIWEFASGNTFGATAFCSFGAFWMAFWFLISSKGDVAAGSSGVGVFLLAWGIFTLYMTVAAFKTSGAVFAVFVALTITFFLLAFGALGNSAALSHLGGYVGIITALLAWYASFAEVVNFTWKRVVLPTFPRA